mmetsp:Transcript_1098/g.2388  ORF Transcript_1098/g.2388 Transcript_1098/m.2388 type:complete len:257 (-) Transcript_1098:496-1266(-)
MHLFVLHHESLHLTAHPLGWGIGHDGFGQHIDLIPRGAVHEDQRHIRGGSHSAVEPSEQLLEIVVGCVEEPVQLPLGRGALDLDAPQTVEKLRPFGPFHCGGEVQVPALLHTHLLRRPTGSRETLEKDRRQGASSVQAETGDLIRNYELAREALLIPSTCPRRRVGDSGGLWSLVAVREALLPLLGHHSEPGEILQIDAVCSATSNPPELRPLLHPILRVAVNPVDGVLDDIACGLVPVVLDPGLRDLCRIPSAAL